MKPIHQTDDCAGFSLTETSLAAGLVSFTLLPLIGLLGVVSTQQSRTTHSETSLIFVETIVQTLKRESKAITKFIWHFPESDEAEKPSSVVVSYPEKSIPNVDIYFIGEESGKIVRSVSANEFENGIPEAELEEVYLIKASMKNQTLGMSRMAGSTSGIELVVSIEYPISVPIDRRNREIHQTHFR